ncbi:CapA family protein [Chloroflexi bacterium TSY]|nr:CapA family protein [Chloroflexi bacterium TSY]
MGTLTVALSPQVPKEYASPIFAILNQTRSVSTGSWLKRPLHVLDALEHASVQVKMEPLSVLQTAKAYPLVERYYAVVVPFDTVQDDIALADLRLRWQGLKAEPLYVTTEAARDLPPVLGIQRVSTLSAKSWETLFTNTSDAVGLLPFEQLDPRYKVLTVDGVNVLDNQLDPVDYPLATALTVQGVGTSQIVSLLQSTIQTQTNRDRNRLTTLVMTGVTAMTRVTAARMEQKGYTYPAEVIAPTLRTADITHISNEVPFLDDCVVNTSLNNLIMCSHTNYWAALEALGTDIVGLSGNHVNDFGRSGARRSIGWYRENHIRIYGSGLNSDEACAPLRWYHHGNTFAFVAALAFGPPGAWASEEQPGACYYYDEKERLLALIQQLRTEVDVVAVELQFEESYNPYPLSAQVREFRELRKAGAQIVTGVQSHVPQAMETYGTDDPDGAGTVVYGLGNLFFDQMQTWATRTGLIARHTIYQGRVIHTEILTAVLEDFAQPRWATEEERKGILTSIFNAAPPRPK